MKVALAQIDMRLGDIEGICDRIEDQARLACVRGARMLCVPAPLFSGVTPGALLSSKDYEHDLLRGLKGLAERIAELDMICLVPAAVLFKGQPLFEFFMLKEGRVIPARSAIALKRGAERDDAWVPPVFDVDGVRTAVVFDLDRDLDVLPTGVDLVIYFQVNALDITDRSTAAVAAVEEGTFAGIASKRSVWLAYAAPVGAYDGALYTGGSFVLDDCGRVVAAAPCFEEHLLVQDVQRGMTLECVPGHELPQWHAEEWLWHALVLCVRDTARARGVSSAVVALEGDLPSSLLAALAVDALGSRNVYGLVVGRDHVFTPAQEEAEVRRREVVRSLAERLHIQTIERQAPDMGRLLDRPLGARGDARLRAGALGLLLDDAARDHEALALSALTKSDFALAAPAGASAYTGDLAPFGDVYLTALEFVARVRNRISPVVPQDVVTLNAVEDRMGQILGSALGALKGPADVFDRVAQILGALEPGEIDGVLEAHVDRNLAFDEIPLAGSKPEACSLLLMVVRAGEPARRMLPEAPVVSARGFAERAWPQMLAWSDTGLHGEERLGVEDLARAEIERNEDPEAAERMRGEVMGLLGDLLGITPEQMDELRSEDGQRRMRENMQKFEGQVQDAIERMMGGGGEGAAGPGPAGGPGSQMPGGMPHPPVDPRQFPFFSQN